MINLRQADSGAPAPKVQAQPVQQVAQAKPIPVSTPHTNNTPVIGDFKRAATGGLGKIGAALMLPSMAFGGFLQGTRKSAEKNAPLVKSGQKNLFSALGQDVTAGVKNIKPGIDKKVTPGSYLTNDVLKLKEGKSKFAAGLATDLVADPLNLVGGILPKIGTMVKPSAKVLQNTKVVQKATEFAKKTPALYKPIEATVKPYFRNPEAGKIIEQTKETITGRTQNLYRQVSEAAKGLTSAKQARIGQLLEGGVTTTKTEPRLVEIANHFKTLGEQVGKELVDQGLLDKASFEKYKGTYMHHFWKSANEGKDPFVKASDIPTIDQSILKHRTGAEGYVKEFAAPTFKGLGTGMRDVEAAKMYKQLGDFGVDVKDPQKVMEAVSKGFQSGADLSKARGGGVLKDKLLPQAVVDYVKRTQKTESGIVGKTYDKALNLWKAGKTIYNPAYHARNVISNHILADMQTGKGLPRTMWDFAHATGKLAGKGDQKHVIEAIDSGLIKKVGMSEGINTLSEPFKKESRLKKIATLPMKAQNTSEDTAKLAVFTHYRRNGFPVAEAKKKAEEAIFSPYKISASERKTLSRIVPFYSFTRQAFPFAAKTLIKHPDRLAKYPKIENSIEQVSAQDKPSEKNMPDYMKGMVRTPMKNSKGENQYVNTKYLYPFGTFTDEGLGIGVSPIVDEAYAQKFNTDSYFGTPIARDGQPVANQNASRADHVANTFLPAAYRSIKGKVLPAAQGKSDYQGRSRDLPSTLVGELGGIKSYPYSSAQGAKSKSYQQYKINEDFKTEKNRILRDQSKTPLERTKELKAVMQRRQERLAQL